MKTTRAVLFCTALLCSAIPGAAQEVDEAALREVSKKFVAAWNKGDAAAVAALYAPDAVVTPPSGQTVRGRKALQESLAGDLRSKARLALSAEEFRPLSDSAAVWRCEWKLSGAKDGRNGAGTGLAVLTRGPSGWLIVEDLVAMSPRASKPAGGHEHGAGGHSHGPGEGHDHGTGGHGHDH